jgi:hypothetical protein
MVLVPDFTSRESEEQSLTFYWSSHRVPTLCTYIFCWIRVKLFGERVLENPSAPKSLILEQVLVVAQSKWRNVEEALLFNALLCVPSILSYLPLRAGLCFHTSVLRPTPQRRVSLRKESMNETTIRFAEIDFRLAFFPTCAHKSSLAHFGVRSSL